MRRAVAGLALVAAGGLLAGCGQAEGATTPPALRRAVASEPTRYESTESALQLPHRSAETAVPATGEQVAATMHEWADRIQRIADPATSRRDQHLLCAQRSLLDRPPRFEATVQYDRVVEPDPATGVFPTEAAQSVRLYDSVTKVNIQMLRWADGYHVASMRGDGFPDDYPAVDPPSGYMAGRMVRRLTSEDLRVFVAAGDRILTTIEKHPTPGA
jgi:hypothetical protein